jgi:glucose-fructose oxidoreductase
MKRMNGTGKANNMKATRATGKTTRSERLRFAVVGLGHFAQVAVLPAFAHAKECELRALFSEDETKLRALKRKYGVEAVLSYEQYDEYLRSGEIDAVYVTVPNDQHRDYVERAARAGVHVLCEKPLAADAAAAERMVEVCSENHVKLMTAYRLHFEAGTLDALERVRRGDLGRTRFFATTFALQVRDGNIRTKRERGGGPLLDLGIYCVNAARSFFRAEPVEVTAMAASRAGDRRFAEIDEQVMATLRFPDDRLAQLACSFGAYDHSFLSVVGDKGRLSMATAYDYAVPLTVAVEIEGKKPTKKAFAKRDQVAAELVAFTQYVREDRTPEPSGEEGLADLRVVDAISRAINSGRAEPVAPTEGPSKPKHPSKDQGIQRPPHAMRELIHAQPGGGRG